MFRFLDNTIKQSLFISLLVFTSSAISQVLYQGDAVQLIDENGHAEIPNTYTSIANEAFRYKSELLSVNIPDSITEIGSDAFGSTGIVSVVIPDSVHTIGFRAFMHASSLENVVLGNGEDIIRDQLFEGTRIREITIPDNVTTINSRAFYNTPLKIFFWKLSFRNWTIFFLWYRLDHSDNT